MKIAVLGGGSWGTALGYLLATKKLDVHMFVRKQAQADSINQNHKNSRYLTDFTLPVNMTASTDLEPVLDGASYIVHAIPVQPSYDFLVANKALFKSNVPIISTSKGLYLKTLQMMSDVFIDIFGKEHPACFLSGPSFAKDVMNNFPTAVVVASSNQDLAVDVQNLFSSMFFRTYTTNDVIGVEVGGAVKNIIAIGSGIVDGLGLGSNTMAALITRGLSEIRKFALAMGGQPDTLAGLSGIGDLMLTCYGSLSRNRTVGVRLGQGESLKEIIDSMTMVAEGVVTADAVSNMCLKLDLDLPIIQTINRVLKDELTAKEAVTDLMMRELKEED